MSNKTPRVKTFNPAIQGKLIKNKHTSSQFDKHSIFHAFIFSIGFCISQYLLISYWDHAKNIIITERIFVLYRAHGITANIGYLFIPLIFIISLIGLYYTIIKIKRNSFLKIYWPILIPFIIVIISQLFTWSWIKLVQDLFLASILILSLFTSKIYENQLINGKKHNRKSLELLYNESLNYFKLSLQILLVIGVSFSIPTITFLYQYGQTEHQTGFGSVEQYGVPIFYNVCIFLLYITFPLFYQSIQFRNLFIQRMDLEKLNNKDNNVIDPDDSTEILENVPNLE